MKSVPVEEKVEKYRCPLCHSDHIGSCSKSVPVEKLLKKNYALIKHIAEIADKYCPDLGLLHESVPALVVIENYITQAIQAAVEGERNRIALEVAQETVDLCENSQEFKHTVLSIINKHQ